MYLQKKGVKRQSYRWPPSYEQLAQLQDFASENTSINGLEVRSIPFHGVMEFWNGMERNSHGME